MKGTLIKKKKEWLVEYLEGSTTAYMPLHPSELQISGLSRYKNKQIEFEVKQEYVGFKHAGDNDSRVYIEINQNYAKLKIN